MKEVIDTVKEKVPMYKKTYTIVICPIVGEVTSQKFETMPETMKALHEFPDQIYSFSVYSNMVLTQEEDVSKQ